MIQIKIVPYSNYTICAIFQSVNVRNRLLLLQSNFILKEVRLNVNYKNYLKEQKPRGINFLKPAFNVAAPFIGMAVSAKTKNSNVGQATTNILKSISGGKILSRHAWKWTLFESYVKIISNKYL